MRKTYLKMEWIKKMYFAEIYKSFEYVLINNFQFKNNSHRQLVSKKNISFYTIFIQSDTLKFDIKKTQTITTN